MFQDSKGEYYPSDTPHRPLLTNQVLCFRIARESTTPATRLIGKRFLTWLWIPSSVMSPFSIIALGPSPSRDRHHGFLSPLIIPDLRYFVLPFLISLLHSFVNCFKHLKTHSGREGIVTWTLLFVWCIFILFLAFHFFLLCMCVCVCVCACPCVCILLIVMFEPLLMSALCDSFCYIAGDILYLGVHYVCYVCSVL